MITMENFATQAVKKLEDGIKEQNTRMGGKESVMAKPIMNALKDFCLQDEEFAQAVVQGGSFADCMKKVAAGVGISISDLDAYKKAVQFFFPGAEVKMQLTIDLIGKAAGKSKPAKQEQAVEEAAPSLVLNLADYF